MLKEKCFNFIRALRKRNLGEGSVIIWKEILHKAVLDVNVVRGNHKSVHRTLNMSRIHIYGV